MRYLLTMHEKGGGTRIFARVQRRNGTQGCHRTSCRSVQLMNPELLSSLHNMSFYSGMASQPDKIFVISSETATAILCSLATVAVPLRLLSRKVSNFNFWWDDAFAIIALVGEPT